MCITSRTCFYTWKHRNFVAWLLWKSRRGRSSWHAHRAFWKRKSNWVSDNRDAWKLSIFKRDFRSFSNQFAWRFHLLQRHVVKHPVKRVSFRQSSHHGYLAEKSIFARSIELLAMTLVLIAILHLHHFEEMSQRCVNRFVTDAGGKHRALSVRKRPIHLSRVGVEIVGIVGIVGRKRLRILQQRRLKRRPEAIKLIFIFFRLPINWVETKSEAKLIISPKNSAEKDAQRMRSEEKKESRNEKARLEETSRMKSESWARATFFVPQFSASKRETEEKKSSTWTMHSGEKRKIINFFYVCAVRAKFFASFRAAKRFAAPELSTCRATSCGIHREEFVIT